MGSLLPDVTLIILLCWCCCDNSAGNLYSIASISNKFPVTTSGLKYARWRLMLFVCLILLVVCVEPAHTCLLAPPTEITYIRFTRPDVILVKPRFVRLCSHIFVYIYYFFKENFSLYYLWRMKVSGLLQTRTWLKILKNPLPREFTHRRTYLPQEQDKDGKMALIHGRSNERSAFCHASVIS